MSLREAAVELARGWADLSADPADPEARASYLDVIACGELPAVARSMATMSGCALVARGYLSRVLAAPPACLGPPYRAGQGPLDVLRAAREADAVRPPGELPAAGDVVHLAGSALAGEHLYLVLSVDDAVESLDGGQRDARGYQAIRVRHRRLARTALGLRDVPAGGAAREVWQVYNLEGLAARYGAAVGQDEG